MILEWFSRFRPKKNNIPPNNEADAVDGFFANATNFTINGANMFDHPQIFQTIHTTIHTGTTALDRLLPHTCPDAAVDSSARHPPPRCHPGTRQRILDILNNWLINHLWKIFWLSGPAGTGKSAVAQTFAEMCLEQGRLGAAYFFFRPSGRDDPRTLIPSLAYQLSVNVPDYGNLLGHTIARDPSIFQKTLRAQMRRLIIEPFTLLQAQGHAITRKPLLVILDGLDECKGIEAQCEIVEMIGEVVRLKKDLPLAWFIASRPEPHLQYVFARADFSIDCNREILLIDTDTRDDVNRYMRDSFEDMRARFSPLVDVNWPSVMQLHTLEDITSGLFALAATIIRYVSDVTYGDPVRRLTDFLAFMSNANHVATTNPLQTLDLLYSQILSQIPENIYPTTKRILAFYYGNKLLPFAMELCCGFLRLDKHELYNALSKLHSLFYIPLSALRGFLHAYHTSFADYLQSQFRSGRFYISRCYTLNESIREYLFWYKTMLEDPLWVSDESFGEITKLAEDTVLPGVTWDGVWVSRVIRTFVVHWTWKFFDSSLGSNFTTELLEDFDYRYMLVKNRDSGFSSFAGWLCTSASHNTLLHTEPRDTLEETLLDKALNAVDRAMEPAIFPLVKMNASDVTGCASLI